MSQDHDFRGLDDLGEVLCALPDHNPAPAPAIVTSATPRTATETQTLAACALRAEYSENVPTYTYHE
jgi:hypothetical protein